MKAHSRTLVLLAASIGVALVTGCPRNTFTIRIVNEADTARVLSLFLDNTDTQGMDSEDLLDGFIDPGESRRFFINVDDANDLNANAIVVGCIEPGPGLSEIIDGTIPFQFTAGGQVTITVFGENGDLIFDI